MAAAVVRSVVTTALLLLAAAAAHAQPPQVTVSGTVTESAYGTAVASATVVLGNFAPFTTDAEGAFRFANVTPGRYILTVHALGYARRDLSLDVRADTTVVVHLEVNPVMLDSLRAVGGDITIRGTIYDRETGDRLSDAQVFLGTGQRIAARLNGAYKVDDITIGQRIAVDAAAFGYVSERIALVTANDTTIDFHLAPDSVSLRMIAEQVQKLEDRSDAVSAARYVFDERRLDHMHGWTLDDILRQHLEPRQRGPYRITCLVVDEMALPRDMDHRIYLDSFLAQEIQRVEVYDQGGMVRVYTKRFIGRQLGNPFNEFPPIIYAGRWGMGNACF